MRVRKHAAKLVVAVGLMLLSGCGLDVMVTADPTTAAAGEEVDFTIMMRNQTNCAVSEAYLFVATFITPEQYPPTLNFCDIAGAIVDPDIERVEAELSKLLPPEQVASLMQAAQDRVFAPGGSGQTVAQCELDPDPEPDEPVSFECEFGTIDPLEKETVTFSAIAPQAGAVRTVAFAFGEIPESEECRPGLWEEGIVLGCFDSAQAGRPAPAASFAGLAGTALALVGLGAFAIARRRR